MTCYQNMTAEEAAAYGLTWRSISLKEAGDVLRSIRDSSEEHRIAFIRASFPLSGLHENAILICKIFKSLDIGCRVTSPWTRIVFNTKDDRSELISIIKTKSLSTDFFI